jgi:hypothetical protein
LASFQFNFIYKTYFEFRHCLVNTFWEELRTRSMLKVWYQIDFKSHMFVS